MTRHPTKVMMKALIRMQQCFPPTILFEAQDGRNFEEDGLRWAPTTFLGRTTSGEASINLKDPERDFRRSPAKPDTAYVDGRGLHVQNDGFELALKSGFQLTSGDPSRLRTLCKTEMFAYSMNIVGGHSSITWSEVSQ